MRAGPVIVVFCCALVFLAAGANASGIATNWVDPIARIQSQDEAVYAASSLEMVRSGDWLTPRFMDRLALHKPPLLYWLSAMSVEVLGSSPLALRLPSILAGSATIALVFAWVLRFGSMAAAIAAALLLLSNHLFFVMSRVGMTDALLLLETVAALFVVFVDTGLTRRSSLWLFSAACGAALMTKSAAGLIPVIIVAAFFVWNPDRPPVRRLLQAAALIALLALPWHLYQLWRHPHWFTTEYVMHELLGKGLGNPAQTTADSPAIFYADRLWRLDPVLCLAALVALAAAWKRSRLLLVWLGVVAVVALTFRYRNVSYILPAYPAMAILVGIAIPRRLAKAALGVALAALACKVALPDRVWGLPHGPEFANHSQEALKRYSALKRPNELIIIDPDDQFFAPLFHPTRVRYVYQGDIGDVSRDELDYHAMGIAVTVEEFARLDERMPQFEQRLQAMDLNSTKPVATVIWARNEAEIAALLAGHPRSDFYLPMRWAHLGNPAHQQREGTSERVFLLGAE